MLRFVKNHLELIFWPAALLALFFMPVDGQHFSLCPLSAAGFGWCPGCGIGHSIHYALHFDFHQSWEEHYLGIFATGIILYRIFQLYKSKISTKPTTNGTADL